jgi:hypothetical protein
MKLENDSKRFYEPMKLNKMDHLQHIGVKVKNSLNDEWHL